MSRTKWEYKFTMELSPDAIKQYGEEGWELVQVVQHMNPELQKPFYEGIFKRPPICEHVYENFNNEAHGIRMQVCLRCGDVKQMEETKS